MDAGQTVIRASGPTEIRTRVSAVRGQRPWPLDDGALPLQKFRGRDSNPDSTVQSRMSCLLDDPGVIAVGMGCTSPYLGKE